MDLLFYVSICGFFLNYYYYLKSLMMVEFIMISVMVVLLGSTLVSCHCVIYILILSVCDGIVGVLMLILICRFWGVDNYTLVDFEV